MYLVKLEVLATGESVPSEDIANTRITHAMHMELLALMGSAEPVRGALPLTTCAMQ